MLHNRYKKKKRNRIYHEFAVREENITMVIGVSRSWPILKRGRGFNIVSETFASEALFGIMAAEVARKGMNL